MADQATFAPNRAANDARLVESKPSPSPSSCAAQPRSDAPARWFERFETIYREAEGEVTRIPWAHAHPCPWAIDWMNRRGREFVRAGARIAVTGCGLGNDVAALNERGYEAIGIDVCPGAVMSAKRRHPMCEGSFIIADLLDLPSHLLHRFDFVVEVHTLQALPPDFRAELAAGIASLLKPRGHVLAVARGRGADVTLESMHAPPFGFTAEEFAGTFASAGLAPVEPIESFMDGGAPPAPRLRGTFARRARS